MTIKFLLKSKSIGHCPLPPRVCSSNQTPYVINLTNLDPHQIYFCPHSYIIQNLSPVHARTNTAQGLDVFPVSQIKWFMLKVIRRLRVVPLPLLHEKYPGNWTTSHACILKTFPILQKRWCQGFNKHDRCTNKTFLNKKSRLGLTTCEQVLIAQLEFLKKRRVIVLTFRALASAPHSCRLLFSSRLTYSDQDSTGPDP